MFNTRISNYEFATPFAYGGRGFYFILCTGASLYAPYSLLLISNKLWMGGGWEGGESVREKLGGRVGGGE